MQWLALSWTGLWASLLPHMRLGFSSRMMASCASLHVNTDPLRRHEQFVCKSWTREILTQRDYI